MVTAPRPFLTRADSGSHDAGPVGELRRQEAAIAEWERRSSTVEVSRSAPRLGALLRPAAGAVTGTYGEARGHGGHPGIDFDGETGDPVVAAAAGTVVAAGPAPSGYAGYGNIVLIDHGAGITTLYAHLSRVAVRTGQTVDQGDYLGAIGTSGHVTGSHLHFEVRVGGRHVNPGPWLAR
jgi:murein DD-endopeptidase MepM/ murein hydrolase activator NlpD